jgi:D-sedoheptulose 7-phosphate isomerase
MTFTRESKLAQRTEFARQYIDGLKKCLDLLSLDQIAQVIGYLEAAIRSGSRIFIIGNGGSAATASHMACDLGKNTFKERYTDPENRFQVMALTDNTPWITALANDLGYDHIFSEQLKNLITRGDLVIAISGSGNSKNILEGIKIAKELGAKVVGLLGFDGGKAKEMVDAFILVESDQYGYVEDIHMVLDHLLTSFFQLAE